VPFHGPTRALERPCVRNAAEAVRLFGDELTLFAHEALRVAHLDRHGRLLALTRQDGDHRVLLVSLGQIVREAAHNHSRKLLIAHNHPDGDPTPSLDDHVATRRIAELLRLIDVELVDHLIFARNGVASFRAMGLL
jgi:DNA repair protein RadC